MITEPARELISSRSNKVIKYLKSLGLARNRHKEGRFLIEGVRIVEEAIELPGIVQKLIVTPQGASGDRAVHLISVAKENGIEVMWVADRVIDYISETKTSQGIMALVRPVEFTFEDLEKGRMPLIVVTHQLQDPGNLGTIIRVAEAAGVSGVVTTPGTVDFYNPKAIRATMGSIFRLPALRADSLGGFIERYHDKGYQVAAAMVSGKVRYFEVDYSKPTILLLGQEGSGLPAEASGLADIHVSIPMSTMMDSLSVACAAGIITYEAVRQKMEVGGDLIRR